MPPEKKRGRPRKEEVRRAPYPSGLPRSKKLGGGEEEKPTTKTNVASISEQQQSEDLNTKLKGKDLEKGEDATDPSDKKNSKFDGLFINGLVSQVLIACRASLLTDCRIASRPIIQSFKDWL